MTEQTAYLFVSNSSRHEYIDSQRVPTHVLTLWEADRAVWELRSLSADAGESTTTCRWIPRSPEHIMHDALLMVASLILGHCETCEALEAMGVNLASDLVDLSEFQVPPLLTDLVTAAVGAAASITACVLNGSSVESQLDHLIDCAGKVEILRSTYRSFH